MSGQDTGYGIRDTGYGIQGGLETGERAALAPVSHILDTEAGRRLRWRARRGLLELDIVLGRFIEASYAGLDEDEKAAFEDLLDLPDNPLWDMISGRQEASHAAQQALLEKIRVA